jgi:hypothetical protein
MKPPAKAESKKAYQPPKLSSYGSLTEMTIAAGGKGNPDSAKGKGKKT